MGRTLIKALSLFPSTTDPSSDNMMDVDDQDDNISHSHSGQQQLKGRVSLGTITGALMGIRALGPLATKSILLPCLPALSKVLGQDQDDICSSVSMSERMQRLTAREALTLVLGDYIRHSMQLPSSTALSFRHSERGQLQEMELCGLEEQLAPFLAAEASPNSQHFLLRLTF